MRCRDRKSTRLNSSHTVIYTLSLHDALPICGFRIERVTQPVLLDQFGAARGKSLVDALVYVDALQPAAGLAGIEKGAVDDVLDGMGQVGIVTHIDRIAAAKLQADTD